MLFWLVNKEWIGILFVTFVLKKAITNATITLTKLNWNQNWNVVFWIWERDKPYTYLIWLKSTTSAFHGFDYILIVVAFKCKAMKWWNKRDKTLLMIHTLKMRNKFVCKAMKWWNKKHQSLLQNFPMFFRNERTWWILFGFRNSNSWIQSQDLFRQFQTCQDLS